MTLTRFHSSVCRIRLPIHVFTVALLILLNGCTSNGPSCKRLFELTWSQHSPLKQDVTLLSSAKFEGRKTGTQGAELTRQFLISRMQTIGLQPWNNAFQHPFEYDYQFDTRQGVNIIGVLNATQTTQAWRVVVAHYDHLGKKGSRLYPGADDNASGVAAMLAMAAHARTQPRPVNVLFVATDAEEPGLFGGKALVDQLKLEQSNPNSTQIELTVNLDMVGHPGRPYSIYVEGRRNFTQFDAIQQRLEQTVGLCVRANHPPEAGRTTQRVDWLRASDHYPFHQAQIPWLYFGVPPHADYHQPTDSANKLDYNFLGAVAESAYELLIIDSYLLNK